MKYTNNYGYPDRIARAHQWLQAQRVSSGTERADISATELLKPPRAVTLKRRHADTLTEDVRDAFATMHGQAWHMLMHAALADDPGVLMAEQRLFAECAGWTISGQPDLFWKDGTLEDYKQTSVYTAKDLTQGKQDDWAAQANIYAWLLRRNGHEVKRIVFYPDCRDWRASESRDQHDYPRWGFAHELPVWPEAQQDDYIAERVALHQLARATLPECTDAERWAVLPKWAAVKAGNKRATKRFETRLEAEQWVVAQKDAAQFALEPREGDPVKGCMYCSARQVCTQYAKLAAEVAQGRASVVE